MRKINVNERRVGFVVDRAVSRSEASRGVGPGFYVTLFGALGPRGLAGLPSGV
jgi:hypothetical protein